VNRILLLALILGVLSFQESQTVNDQRLLDNVNARGVFVCPNLYEVYRNTYDRCLQRTGGAGKCTLLL
jgi:hypothetical protein|tara:strand:- start:4792 stop:4995 length:204 start_codon:yes stop_codon:yes gene_type:complete